MIGHTTQFLPIALQITFAKHMIVRGEHIQNSDAG